MKCMFCGRDGNGVFCTDRCRHLYVKFEDYFVEHSKRLPCCLIHVAVVFVLIAIFNLFLGISVALIAAGASLLLFPFAPLEMKESMGLGRSTAVMVAFGVSGVVAGAYILLTMVTF
jgi:succinate dehydrogenase/fumarate reductase cytochrome b subunit